MIRSNPIHSRTKIIIASFHSTRKLFQFLFLCMSL
jgi:hypothetical protein